MSCLHSRARHGMYDIGNSSTPCHVPRQEQVISFLENDGKLGQTLALCCPQHQKTPFEVSEPDDFPIISPEGAAIESAVHD